MDIERGALASVTQSVATEEPPLSVRVAMRIRALLSDRRLSHEWLSETSGINLRTLSRRLDLRHPRGLMVDELNAIALALNVHPGELLRD
jgi:DNA-binding Xre family transcriptional regulator